MRGQRAYFFTGICSAVVTAAAIAGGLLYSLSNDSRLPSADLRYMPELQALVAVGRLEEASDELNMVSRLDPRNLVAIEMFAQVAGELGQHGRQLRALKMLLLEYPDSPELRLRYSRAVVDRARVDGGAPPRRQLERAISGAQLALRSDPDSAVAHETLGEAWLLLGDIEQAKRHLQEALRLDPSLESARRELERASGAGQSS